MKVAVVSRDVTTNWKTPKAPKKAAKPPKRPSEWCEVRVDGCRRKASQTHHIRRRSQGGTNEPHNLLAVCHVCHGWVHNNVAAAKVAGWLA